MVLLCILFYHSSCGTLFCTYVILECISLFWMTEIKLMLLENFYGIELKLCY